MIRRLVAILLILLHHFVEHGRASGLFAPIVLPRQDKVTLLQIQRLHVLDRIQLLLRFILHVIHDLRPLLESRHVLLGWRHISGHLHPAGSPYRAWLVPLVLRTIIDIDIKE